ncbi:centromere protein R isoform X5 [Columba livia]|uniref:centromere protein R isoform X5 n=1 Tax=Columba livia TaxID=8932 RepID=UPI000A362FFF|nr:centromere protein R isoform X6 [Columba livia]XP_021151969.1 centromere protein R isoform X6 [Columba livia]
MHKISQITHQMEIKPRRTIQRADYPEEGSLKQSRMRKCTKFVELQSKVKNSLVRILKIRAQLTNLQALEGSRELENIIGVSSSSCNLRAEVQKTQVLMSQAEELQLLKRNHGKLPARAPRVLSERSQPPPGAANAERHGPLQTETASAPFVRCLVMLTTISVYSSIFALETTPNAKHISSDQSC